MRFNEIENISNNDDILRRVKRYVSRNASVEIVNGLIDVDGDFELTKSLPKLPYKFGKVTGDFMVNENTLETLEGCPYFVGGEFFNCGFNYLTSLIGGPIKVMGDYIARGNEFISLDGLPKEMHGDIHLEYREDLPMLKLLFINKLSNVVLYNNYVDTTNAKNIVADILNKYLGKGRGAALACAAELSRAGFKGNARL